MSRRRQNPGDPTPPVPVQTFENFDLCDGNRLAHAAALAVAEYPGQANNPLTLHGAAGSGKTHLLHAIAIRALALGTTRTVRLLSAIPDPTPIPWAPGIREHDVILIDDAHAINPALASALHEAIGAAWSVKAQLVLAMRPCDASGSTWMRNERIQAGVLGHMKPRDDTSSGER